MNNPREIFLKVIKTLFSPLALLYVVLYASEYVYYSQRCSRLDRIGSPICEYSHKLFTKTRNIIHTFIDNCLTTVGAVALGGFTKLLNDKKLVSEEKKQLP